MPHSVEFNLQPEDVSAFRRAVAASAPKPRRQSRIILLWWGILLALAALSAAVKWGVRGFVLVAAPIIIVVGLVAFFVWRGLRRLSPPELKLLTARHRVEISREGVAQSGEYGSSAFPWKIVEDIRDTNAHVFIFNGPNSAVVIPARAFATETGFRQFVEKAQEYRRAATTAPSQVSGEVRRA